MESMLRMSARFTGRPFQSDATIRHGVVRSHQTRLGFTMIETMVVLAIIMLLMGLLMPAILSARASARQTECLNKLRQWGIDFHGVSREDLDRYCPSDGTTRDMVPDLPSEPLVNYLHSDGYFGGDGYGGGVIVDGRSNTAYMPEVIRANNRLEIPRVVWQFQGAAADFKAFQAISYACPEEETDQWTALVSAKGYGSYTHALTPSRPSCATASGQFVMITAGSFHPAGVVNTSFCDGSTRPIPPEISPEIWKAMGTRDGNDVALESYQ